MRVIGARQPVAGRVDDLRVMGFLPAMGPALPSTTPCLTAFPSRRSAGSKRSALPDRRRYQGVHGNKLEKRTGIETHSYILILQTQLENPNNILLIILVVEAWSWNYGRGILVVEFWSSWPWNPAHGILALESWLWNPGCGIRSAGSNTSALPVRHRYQGVHGEALRLIATCCYPNCAEPSFERLFFY